MRDKDLIHVLRCVEKGAPVTGAYRLLLALAAKSRLTPEEPEPIGFGVRFHTERTPDGKHIFFRKFIWDDDQPATAVIMAHPRPFERKAIERCVQMASDKGAGGVYMTYLYTRKVVDDGDLYLIGARNARAPGWSEHILHVLMDVNVAVGAWGKGEWAQAEGPQVLKIARKLRVETCHCGLWGATAPRQPFDWKSETVCVGWDV